MSDLDQTTFRAGDIIDCKWVILELVGRGGMAEVYRAYQLKLGRQVAIKVISHKLIEEIGADEDEAALCLERFRREVKVMAQIQHPNVVRVFDYGSASIANGQKEARIEYIVMEFMPGTSLRTSMSVEGFYPDVERAGQWVRDCFIPLLDGVAALHRLGIVHRDLKPENVLFDGKKPRITDFGIARSSSLEPITRSVEIRGTPAYMSPEHFLDFRRSDERADIYSLGKILHEAISGKFKADQIPFKQASLEEPESQFFKALDLVIKRATALDKGGRFQSVEEMKSALEQLCARVLKSSEGTGGPGTSKKSPRFVPALIVIAALVVLIGLAAALSPAGVQCYLGLRAGKAPIAQKHESLKNGARGGKIPRFRITGRDGAVLHLIPGGEMPAGAGGNPARIGSFYMDEYLVTNYQFIEFLNDSLSKITVKDNAVIAGGHLWLFLGDVVKGYAPILHRNGRFELSGAQHSSCPVLRVTAYGAEAYAGHYGRRLPSVRQWIYVALKGKLSRKLPSVQGLGFGPNFSAPVLDMLADRFGIRGLDGQFGEWAWSGGGAGYVVLGNQTDNGLSKTGRPRNPWDASGDVGFRTVSAPSETPSP